MEPKKPHPSKKQTVPEASAGQASSFPSLQVSVQDRETRTEKTMIMPTKSHHTVSRVQELVSEMVGPGREIIV